MEWQKRSNFDLKTDHYKNYDLKNRFMRPLPKLRFQRSATSSQAFLPKLQKISFTIRPYLTFFVISNLMKTILSFGPRKYLREAKFDRIKCKILAVSLR